MQGGARRGSLPPLDDEIGDVVLTESPAVVVRTLTVKTQLPLAGIVAPLRLTWPLPSTAVIVPPPHVPLRPPVEIVIPAGSVSVNAIPFSETLLVLVMVKLRPEVWPTEIDDGVNAMLRVGASATTTDAVAVEPFPPSVDVTLEVVVLCVPTVVPLTSTSTVHCRPM